jgi:hypothetical protein
MPSAAVDAQISAVERLSTPQSVLDAVLSKAEVESYDAANPFLLRVMLCGKKKSLSFAGILEKVVSEVKRESDLANPFYSEKSAGQIGTFVIDYGENFVQLVEGPERYVFSYAEKLNALPFVDSSSVRVLYLDDDIPKMIGSGVTIIDKVPPSSLTISSSDKDADDVADLVVHDVTSVIELGTQASNQAARMKSVFTDNAKINFPKLFPRVEFLTAYMKSDSFFTLEEFIVNFAKPANLVREVEITHPAEDPLSY